MKKIGVKKDNHVEVVDFIDFDIMRSVSITLWNSLSRENRIVCSNMNRPYRVPYQKSFFYIGKGTARFVLHGLLFNREDSEKLCRLLTNEFREYTVYLFDKGGFKNIYIYLYGFPNIPTIDLCYLYVFKLQKNNKVRILKCFL